jgi:hypothetical protein
MGKDLSEPQRTPGCVRALREWVPTCHTDHRYLISQRIIRAVMQNIPSWLWIVAAIVLMGYAIENRLQAILNLLIEFREHFIGDDEDL